MHSKPKSKAPKNSPLLIRLLRFLLRRFSLGIASLVRWLLKLRKGDRIWGIVWLLIWIVILVAYFFPTRYTFNGYLQAREMNFTYTGFEQRLFLTLDNIKQFDLQGSQPNPLTLRGKFSSSDPQLNQKLSHLTKLQVQLPYATSRIIIAPVDEKSPTTELSISELRINPDIQIQHLAYQTAPNQMSFCLQNASQSPQACLFPENLPIQATPADSPSIGRLALKLGQQKLNLTFGKFNSPELGNGNDTSFDYIPIGDELQLNILSPTQLFISLPKIAKTSSPQSNDFSESLWGDLDVKNVQFFQYKRNPTNVTDEQEISTIIEGKVRMGNQTMDLQADQFLILPSNEPGITKLRYIRLNTKSPQGLSTTFTGSSTRIAAGLYPEFPVQEIHANFLSKFPPEAISALLSFIAALTGMFLPRLFAEKSPTS